MQKPKRIHTLNTTFRKCQSFAGALIYLTLDLDSSTVLGHTVSSAGVKVSADKIRAVSTFPTAQDIKEVLQFLGMAGWQYRFTLQFSQLTERPNALKIKRPYLLYHSQNTLSQRINHNINTMIALKLEFRLKSRFYYHILTLFHY